MLSLTRRGGKISRGFVKKGVKLRYQHESQASELSALMLARVQLQRKCGAFVLGSHFFKRSLTLPMS